MMNNTSNNGGMSRKALMNKVSALGLATHEAVLFLDTHPDCREAMEYFNASRHALDDAVREYEKCFGPLTAFSTDTEDGWSWIKSPWPWDTENARTC